MSDNTPHNIHDTFFRDTLSRKEIAADFLQNYLPAHVLRHLELDSLTISKETFVDVQQSTHYSDMLYQVSLTGGQKGFVYVLFEHKSFPDKFTALQLLRYMLEIWELHRKQNPASKSRLPLIIPVIVYHGKSKGKAVRLADLIHIPEEALRGYVPDFDVNFYDFSPKAEEAIKGQILLQTALYCFKASHHSQAKLMVVEIFSRIACLDDSNNSLQWVRMVWQYVSETVNMEPKEVLEIAKQNLSGKKDGEVMTIAQRLEHKGRTEGIVLGHTAGRKEGRLEGHKVGRIKGEAVGRASGRVEGRTTLLTRQLTRKFGEHALTSAVQQRLQMATTDQLDHWGERILDAGSIGEVFTE